MQSSWYPEIIHYPDRIWGITQLCQDCKLVLRDGERRRVGDQNTGKSGKPFLLEAILTVNQWQQFYQLSFCFNFLTDKPERNLMQLLLKHFLQYMSLSFILPFPSLPEGENQPICFYTSHTQINTNSRVESSLTLTNQLTPPLFTVHPDAVQLFPDPLVYIQH